MTYPSQYQTCQYRGERYVPQEHTEGRFYGLTRNDEPLACFDLTWRGTGENTGYIKNSIYVRENKMVLTEGARLGVGQEVM